MKPYSPSPEAEMALLPPPTTDDHASQTSLVEPPTTTEYPPLATLPSLLAPRNAPTPVPEHAGTDSVRRTPECPWRSVDACAPGVVPCGVREAAPVERVTLEPPSAQSPKSIANAHAGTSNRKALYRIRAPKTAEHVQRDRASLRGDRVRSLRFGRLRRSATGPGSKPAPAHPARSAPHRHADVTNAE
jgi:hypothetical protein